MSKQLTKFQRYDAYKDSGVEWIGDVPVDWRRMPLKRALNEKLQYGANKSGIEYNPDLPRYIRITDFSINGSLSEKSKLSLTWQTGRAYLLDDGDILFARSGATVGKCYQFKRSMSNEKYYAFAGYLIKARANKEKLLSDFLKFYSSSSCFNVWKEIIFNKATIENIGADKYAEFPILLPPLTEQTAIANFLIQKTTQIDQAIAIKEKQIELLQERKQILIQNAVTRGLDPNVRMKDSGVVWIGEMPEEWKVESFSNILVERNKKNYPIESRERLSLSIDKGITLYADKTTNLDRFKDDFTQYKLAYEGDLVFNSMNMIVGAVGVSNYFGCVSPVYYTYYTPLEEPKITKYFEYFFKTRLVQSQLYCLGRGIMAIDRGEGKFNTVRLKVSRADLRSMKVPCPTISEIIEIVDFIELESSKISKAINLLEQQIEKLKEYKATLINSAVTGKIKVV